MKKILKQLLLVLTLCLIALLVLSACGPMGSDNGDASTTTAPTTTAPVLYALRLTADKTEVVRGDTVTLSAVLFADGQADIPSEDTVYTIVSGSSYVELIGNVLTVLNGAPDGATVTLQAREGVSSSNTITLTVNVPVTSISISAGGATNVIPGSQYQLAKTVLPVGAPTNATWEITEGSGLAEMNGDTLVVNQNAPTGATIKVKAKLDGKESQELSFTVGYPLTGIALSYAGGTNILPGTVVPLAVELSPTNTTNGAYTLEFLSGGDAVTVSGNFLTVKADAVTGTVVKLKAVAGTKESNEVSFVVGYPLTAIWASLANGQNVLAGTKNPIEVSYAPTNATNADYTWVVTAGAEAVTVSGKTLTVKANAVTGTVVKVKAVVGAKESEEITFIVGYPLETIEATLKNGKNVLAGTVDPIKVEWMPANATNADYTWEILSGAEAVTVSGKTLAVKADAVTGTVVRVKAVAGAKESNEVSFTVGYPVETLLVSLKDVANVLAGTVDPIAVSYAPANATNADYNWIVVAGADAVTVSGKTLTVKADAVTGTVVTVKAVAGTKMSEEISFIVGYPLASITISNTGNANLPFGEAFVLPVPSLSPANATNGEYHFEIVEGADAVTLSGNTLTVKEGTKTGTLVKVKAVTATKESNVLTYVVGYPLEDLEISLTDSSTYMLPGQSAHLSVATTPANTTNGGYRFEIVEGAEHAELVGDLLTVKTEAPLEAVIKLKAVATDADGVESNTLVIVVNTSIETITISAETPAILERGESYPLTLSATPEDASLAGIAWKFAKGGEWAKVVNGQLMVHANTPGGTEIELYAASGTLSSNRLTFTVGVKLLELEIALEDGPTSIEPSDVCRILSTLTPSNASDTLIEWMITEGTEYATIVGDEIRIKSGATVGATVTFYAKIGDVTSNSITVTVGVPVEKVEISLDDTNINPGESRPIECTVTPSNATQKDVKWVITEGTAFATVTNGVITIKSGATIGETVTFHAEVGGKKSESITVTVGVPVEKVEISLGDTNINPGESRPIECTVTPSNATQKDVKWVVTVGSDYATVANGVITIKSGATVGEKVTFYAEVGGKKSESITVTVGVPVEKVEISLDDTNINPGESRPIECTVTPSNATQKNITWVIVSGSDYATVANGVITIKSGATIGETVTFYAEVGGKKSNEFTVTVGIPVTGLTISAIGSTDVVKGNTVSLSATLAPTGATANNFAWVIVEGSEYGEIVENTLVVKSTATTGGKIKVKAIADGKDSNVLEFTVMATQEEIQASQYILQLSTDTLTVDKRGASTPVLVAKVYNGNFQQVYDLDIAFEIVSGGEYLSLTPDGMSCSFSALGHGAAKVKATIAGYDVSLTADVNVIVPPDSVNLPEVFRERKSIEYHFSLIDPRTGAAETLPFVATAYSNGNSLICRDLVYSFAHEDGTTGDEVATYEDGRITFLKKGKVTVTVTSASGSRVEASSSYVFQINDGYNANDFKELREILSLSKYNGQIINLVVTEKPDGSATNYEYGYDLVPPTALLPESEQTISKIRSGGNRIQVVNKNAYINGNNHTIDGSQMRPYTYEEFAAWAEANGKTDAEPYTGYLFGAETWPVGGVNPGEKDAYSIKFYNLTVKGNCPVNYSQTEQYKQEDGKTYAKSNEVYGCYTVGVKIGSNAIHGQFYIDADNIWVEGFKNGVELSNIVGNGKISNVYAGNCYATGIVTHSSIVTIENMTFGPCGATGIEMTSVQGVYDANGLTGDKAGINNDQDPEVTLSGTINATGNRNNGNSVYFQNYTFDGGVTIPYIITGNIMGRPDSQVSHIRNENGEYVFVALMLKDLSTGAENPTKVIYPAFQQGGIVSIDALGTGTDTTHQYIELVIYAPMGPGGANIPIGTALFYNYNYGK